MATEPMANRDDLDDDRDAIPDEMAAAFTLPEPELDFEADFYGRLWALLADDED